VDQGIYKKLEMNRRKRANERERERERMRKSERGKKNVRELDEASHARYNEVICVFLGVNPEGIELHCVLVGLSRQRRG